MCITILALQMDTTDCLQMSRCQSHLKYEPSANVKIEVIPITLYMICDLDF